MKAFKIELDGYGGTLVCVVLAENPDDAVAFGRRETGWHGKAPDRVEEIDISGCTGLLRHEFIQKEVSI